MEMAKSKQMSLGQFPVIIACEGAANISVEVGTSTEKYKAPAIYETEDVMSTKSTKKSRHEICERVGRA